MSAEPNAHSHLGADHQLPAPPTQHRSNVTRIIVWVALLLVFAGVFYYVLTHKEAPQTKGHGGRHGGAAGGSVTLSSATAQRGDIGVYINAIGTVTPVYTSAITPQVSGVITAVHYTEGQFLHKGDALIDIDARPYRATLLQAQGILERDQNILAQAQMDVERYRAAWARNAIPKQTLDDQEKLVLQGQGTVKNDEGTVQYDQIQVDFCHIVAPFDGKVGLRLIDPGNVVTANSSTVLAVITQIQPITVVFTIPEDSLPQVAPKLRKQMKLTVDAFDRAALKQVASGTLMSLDNQVDTTTGTVKARASFTNKDLLLYPNEFVNTRLLVDTVKNAVLVPSSAIQHNGKIAFVYVIQDNVANMRTVTPGVSDSGNTQVQGINAGDVLANSGFEKLQDKSRVVISSQPAPSGEVSGSDAP